MKPTIKPGSDHLVFWADGRTHPGWLIGLVTLAVSALIFAALLITLRVSNFSVRVIPDTGSLDVTKRDLPSDPRLLSAGWQIANYMEVWRAKELDERYVQVSAYLSPKIRGEIKVYFTGLQPRTSGLTDVAVARNILPLGAKVLSRSANEAKVALAYHSIDLVEDSKTVTIARDEVQELIVTLVPDAITDENPYGVLAVGVDRRRGDEVADKFWMKP